MPKASETMAGVSRKISDIAKGWDIKELDVRINDSELYVSLKAVKPEVAVVA